MARRLRARLAATNGAVGTWVTSTDSAVVEVLALAGFDFIAVDLEHSGLSLETLYSHARAAMARDISLLVRTPTREPKFLLRVLDAGVDGVIATGVGSASDAAAVVAAVRYPPVGERGISGVARSSDYGAHGLPGVVGLTQRENTDVVAGILVEDPGAVAEIEAIANTPGLDLVVIGPQDLSASMGRLGSVSDPLVADAIQRVQRACLGSGVTFGMPAGHSSYPLTWSQLRSAGARLTTVSTDVGLLMGGSKSALQQLRAAQ
jgi:4-hydroxy-2-oxoheptanedioate aldolase